MKSEDPTTHKVMCDDCKQLTPVSTLKPKKKGDNTILVCEMCKMWDDVINDK
jgi:hypothetical protein